MEQGIAENVLEMALRGKPREPFYMVGRMEGQSVVLRAEKGKLRLMVDDEQGGGKKEMIYEVGAKGEEKDCSIKKEKNDGQGREAEGGEVRDRGQERQEGFEAYGRGEVSSGALDMDGETQTGRSLPGDGDNVEFTEPVAGPGDGGDALGAKASGCGGKGGSIEPTSCGIVGAEEQRRRDERVEATFGQTPGEPGQTRGAAGGCSREEGLTIFGEMGDGRKGTWTQEGEGEKACAGAGVGDSPGAQWSLNGKGGSDEATCTDYQRIGMEDCVGILASI
jgi:hypothetical protein